MVGRKIIKSSQRDGRRGTTPGNLADGDPLRAKLKKVVKNVSEKNRTKVSQDAILANKAALAANVNRYCDVYQEYLTYIEQQERLLQTREIQFLAKLKALSAKLDTLE